MATDRISAMTDEQIKSEFALYCTVRNAEYEAFVAGLTPDERTEYFARLEALINADKPHGAKKDLHVLALIATFRFAQAAEYLLNGDSE